MAKKEEIIKDFQTHAEDTGSDEVQAALASQKIDHLLEHLKENPKDLHSKRGLLQAVAKRRKILKHLKREDQGRHSTLIQKLGLKK